MDINTKSKYRRGQAALTENEINDLLNVVKESAEAVAEAVKESQPIVEEQTVAPKVEMPKSGRKFYAIEKNNSRYEVIEAIEQNGVITRSRVVESHLNVAVAIAKLSECISRLCMIKKEY